MDKNVQTRSEETGVNYVTSVKEAIDSAKQDTSIWKISFSLGNEWKR